MAWEWRVFCAGSGNKFWRQEHPLAGSLLATLVENVPEVRPDFYYNVRIKECGLKERWEESNKSLELKILENTIDGIDYWTKLPFVDLSSEVSERDGPGLEFIVSGLEQMRGSNSEGDRWIDRTLQSIQLRKPERFRVNKKRSQCRAIAESANGAWRFQRDGADGAGVVVVETAEIRIIAGNSPASQIFQSVCVEGDDRNVVQRFIQEFVLSDVGQVMGYPKMIMTL